MTFLLPIAVSAILLHRKESGQENDSSNRWHKFGVPPLMVIMTAFIRILFIAAVFAVGPTVPSRAADTVRLAVQKTGTFAWELAVIRAHGPDGQANLAVEVQGIGKSEAGKIALRGGAADIIVSDWLWVSRERGVGAKLTFYPYSERARRGHGVECIPDPHIGRPQGP